MTILPRLRAIPLSQTNPDFETSTEWHEFILLEFYLYWGAARALL